MKRNIIKYSILIIGIILIIGVTHIVIGDKSKGLFEGVINTIVDKIENISIFGGAFLVVVEAGDRLTKPKKDNAAREEEVAWKEIREAYTQSDTYYQPLVKALEYLSANKKLSGQSINLPKANLNNINLSGAILQSANLSGANLSFANLQSVQLSLANLGFANLGFANLSGVILFNADLNYAFLQSANLSGAVLNFATLQSANLENANLENAKIQNTNLSFANLQSANLENANLENANLSYANLENTDLSYALNLTPEQVMQANNWKKAKYNKYFRAELGLLPEPDK